MSIWTHVVGVARIDAFDYDETRNLITSILGTPANYDSEPSVWNNCKLPIGREGSVQYQIVQTGKAEEREYGSYIDLAAFCVAFWGDLRDFDYAGIHAEIAPWWNAFVSHPELMIRQALLVAETEGHEPVSFGIPTKPAKLSTKILKGEN